MTSRVIRSSEDVERLVTFMGEQRFPFTVNLTKGASRTLEQNKLQRKWLTEIADQWEGHTSEEIRGFCKLHMGVPLMREENEEFREKYDRIIKPHSYEDKLEMMQEPLDFPVTRLMNTSQKTRYLDRVYEHFAGNGFELTIPPEKGSAPVSSSPGAAAGETVPPNVSPANRYKEVRE